MIHFIYLDHTELNLFIDVTILGTTEFLGALVSKLFLKHFKRRTIFALVCLFLLLNFFSLLIFSTSNIQTKYVVTICTRGVL